MAIPRFRPRNIISNRYPHLIRTENLLKEINDFPVSFNAGLDRFISSCEVEGGQYVGILKGYERFLTAMVTQNFDGLEEFVEHNFLEKSKKSLENLTSKGYKIKQRGDLLYSNIEKVSSEKIYGNVLPYRNLNIPSKYYSVKNPYFNFSQTKITTYKYSSYNYLPDYEEEFHKFSILNLDSLNRSEDPYSMDETIKEILIFIGHRSIYYDIMECSIQTNYKIFVEDPNGKVVAGKNDDSYEYHTIRLEKLMVCTPLHGIQKLLAGVLMYHHTGLYFMIDFDGFMETNPLINS